MFYEPFSGDLLQDTSLQPAVRGFTVHTGRARINQSNEKKRESSFTFPQICRNWFSSTWNRNYFSHLWMVRVELQDTNTGLFFFLSACRFYSLWKIHLSCCEMFENISRQTYTGVSGGQNTVQGRKSRFTEQVNGSK